MYYSDSGRKTNLPPSVVKMRVGGRRNKSNNFTSDTHYLSLFRYKSLKAKGKNLLLKR